MTTNAIAESPSADEIALVGDMARESLASLHLGAPDEHWPQCWPADWNTLAQQGLWSTSEPPDGSLAMASAVMAEMGRALYPGPACEVLVANYVLHGLGGSVAGLTVPDATPAIAFASDRSAMVGVAADTQLLVATDQDELVVLEASQAHFDATASLDVTRTIVQPRLSGEAAMSSSDPAFAIAGRRARALLYCADTLGCVERVLERTAEYAGQRTTFGSLIGKYQAVAHRLVDHAVTAQQMRLLLEAAVAAFDDGAPDVALQVATTETFFCSRSSDIISDCIQLAGAIGFTWEFGHHFYLRRAVQNAALAGGRGRPRQRLAREARW